MKQKKTDSATFGQAVVIGSSISGLTAARVLANHFAKVIIIDRDNLPDKPQFRRGIPQAKHAHTLPLRGQEILEELFPGLSGELAANGAITINGGSEMGYFIAGDWHQVKHHSALLSMTSSRPLLESTLYRRLANEPKVQIIQAHEVTGLVVDQKGRRVSGVRLRERHGSDRHEMELAADLVVDASGRDSNAPQWLADFGYSPPRESTINAFSGYASRVYRQPARPPVSWKTLYVRPSPPNSRRGGLLIPIEGDRWHVTLVGMARDYPPVDEEGFMAFARSLPTPELYEAIKVAEPLSHPSGYRRNENRVRHFDQLPHYLEGFVVTGDAAYALNPVYAQGMTAAVLGSQALDRGLQQQSEQRNLIGLAKTFQAELGRAVAAPWKMAIMQDQRWPDTITIDNISPLKAQIDFNSMAAASNSLASS
jgi:2-polyprenyl-6-methoxyphenol hydroxylase-like FAD-dependent oxidoreductase